MTTASNGLDKHLKLRVRLRYAILILLLLLTLRVQQVWIDLDAEREFARFEGECEEVVRLLNDGLRDYSMVLHGGAGAYAASEELTRKEWRDYYSYREVERRYPGIRAVAFSKVVDESQLGQHIESVRAEGFAEYSVRSGSHDGVYVPIVYTEPSDGVGLSLLGYDVYAHPMLREAMHEARDTGLETISRAISLQALFAGAGDGSAAQIGFLMFVPVYRNGASIGSVEERRAAIEGYMVGVFTVADFFSAVFGTSLDQVRFDLYDGDSVSPDSLIYSIRSSDQRSNPMFRSQATLDLHGHQWTLAFETTAAFEAAVDTTTAPGILLVGVIVSILAFLVLRMQERIIGQARALADGLSVSLGETKERLEATLRSIGDGVIACDCDGRVTGINRAAESLTGWPYDQAVGRSIDEVFHIVSAIDRRPVENPIQRSIAQGVIVGLANHTMLIARDGTQYHIADSCAPIHGPRGEIIGAVLVFRDVTEEYHSREELRRSEENYRLLTDNLPIGVARIGRNMEILMVNATMREWFRGSDFSAPLPCYTVFDSPDTSKPCDGCPIVETFKDGQVHHADREVVTSLGPRTMSIVAMPVMDENGNIHSVLEVVDDVTDRRVAEQERIAREAAEEANRAKSAFVANMSHEIRTPLNAIIGFAQILERDASLTAKQAEYVHTIARSGRHLLRLINDVLDLSKIEAGKLRLSKTNFCLFDLLADLEMMFKSQAEARGLHFDVEIGEDVPRFVAADESKLRQILVNLMGNAVKFTSAGQVSVRVRTDTSPTLSVPTDESKDDLVILAIEVEDTGPGIPEEELESVFDAFRQSEEGARLGGTGLGLTISSRLVELMGGDLTLKSEVRRGSCFTVRVPVVRVEGVVEQRLESNRVIGLRDRTQAVRILLVDDQKDNRELLRAVLEPIGFELRESADGLEALKVVADWQPHAVLMDMRMPVMDGYEATRRIRASKATRHTCVIAVTASAFESDESEIMSLGVDAYVRKPIEPDELLDALARCLDLRYEYAEVAAMADTVTEYRPLAREDIAALPVHLVESMRMAVDDGDIFRLKALIQQVEEINPQTAHGLEVLARNFEYERLSQVLRQ